MHQKISRPKPAFISPRVDQQVSWFNVRRFYISQTHTLLLPFCYNMLQMFKLHNVFYSGRISSNSSKVSEFGTKKRRFTQQQDKDRKRAHIKKCIFTRRINIEKQPHTFSLPLLFGKYMHNFPFK